MKPGTKVKITHGSEGLFGLKGTVTNITGNIVKVKIKQGHYVTTTMEHVKEVS